MINEILPGVFQIGVPFARHPLRGIHDYLFAGHGRNLLVDTALNDDLCHASLLEDLRKLNVSLEETDIFLTHLHVDHSGLISRLKTDGNKVFASAPDHVYIDAFQSASHWQWLTRTNAWCGTPEEHALKPEEHVAHSNRPSRVVPIEEVRPGGILSCGDYELEIVDLAGHTPGQIGLWHPATGSLFSGDHVLQKITPNITAWNLEHDYLNIFLDSLKRVREMPVRAVYPAHGTPVIKDPGSRIGEMLCHHADRLRRMEELVKAAGGPATAFQIAQGIEWSRGKAFTELAIQEKWFACSETLAHLLHLVNKGKLRMRTVEETRIFYL